MSAGLCYRRPQLDHLLCIIHRSSPDISVKMGENHLYKLPNEVSTAHIIPQSCHISQLTLPKLLLSILTPIPTPQLVPLTLISHRIYTLILRILHNRLLISSSLEDHCLLLDCYHPSDKLTAPTYFCTYKGTDGLSTYQCPDEDDLDLSHRLGELRTMYSRFRPYRRDLDAEGRRVLRPPGDIPGTRTFAGSMGEEYSGEAVKLLLGLEDYERFTQLCAVINLVKLGPKNGLFTRFVDVNESVVRVFRGLLKELASRTDEVVVEDIVASGRQNKPVQEAENSKTRSDLYDEGILWLNDKQTAGLRLKVRQRKFRRDNPILIRTDEEEDDDLPVTFEVEFHGKSFSFLHEFGLQFLRTPRPDVPSAALS